MFVSVETHSPLTKNNRETLKSLTLGAYPTSDDENTQGAEGDEDRPATSGTTTDPSCASRIP